MNTNPAQNTPHNDLTDLASQPQASNVPTDCHNVTKPLAALFSHYLASDQLQEAAWLQAEKELLNLASENALLRVKLDRVIHQLNNYVAGYSRLKRSLRARPPP